MDICAKDKCTGCFACVNACSHGCISMQEDELGCVHPVVDETNCINCGLCKSSCPNNIELKFSYPIKCYASWIEDKEKRKTMQKMLLKKLKQQKNETRLFALLKSMTILC